MCTPDYKIMETGVVYKITCPEGFSYIGKTRRTLSTRVKEHMRDSSDCKAIQDAFRRHGNNMKTEILLVCNIEDLDMNESICIQSLDTIYPRGYNLRCGKVLFGQQHDSTALSTFVIPEPVCIKDDNMEITKAAVINDINDITVCGGLKPWSGTIKMSIKDINFARGAKQFCTWAGPVKGVPLKEYAGFERSIPESTWPEVMMDATDKESLRRIIVSQNQIEISQRESSYYDETLKKRIRADEEIIAHRTKLQKQKEQDNVDAEFSVYRVRHLEHKIKIATENGRKDIVDRLTTTLMKIYDE